MTAVAVDSEGAPIALLRMDGVPALFGEFALDKAYTAATVGAATHELCAKADATPSLRLGLVNRPRLLVWGGGLPVLSGGVFVGGIGVSGSSEENDIAAARYALGSLAV